MSGRGRGRERMRIQDLPPGATLTMLVLQSTIGIVFGWFLARGIQRMFLAGYVAIRDRRRR